MEIKLNEQESELLVELLPQFKGQGNVIELSEDAIEIVYEELGQFEVDAVLDSPNQNGSPRATAIAHLVDRFFPG